jgi:hypothetical protein
LLEGLVELELGWRGHLEGSVVISGNIRMVKIKPGSISASLTARHLPSL